MIKSLERMTAALRRLPGVGPRQAERFCMYFLKSSAAEVEEFSSALKSLKSSVKMCAKCFAYSDGELCRTCSDNSRLQSVLCVVEEPQDIEAVERTGSFGGLYHVLHGAVSPLDGVGIDSLKARELVQRIKDSAVPVEEVIIATDPDAEGESTAMYIADLLRGLVPKVTRIAYGVPLGGDIDYMDEMTLGYALKGRTKL